MDPSSSRALARRQEMEVDLAAYGDADGGSSSGAEDSLSIDGGGEGSDLESMTGRGIKCLYSELLELKKSSDEDFQKSVYSNYSTFIRVFKGVGDIESELMELKRHVSDQKRLVKCLIENFCPDIFSEDLLELKGENDLKVGYHLLSKTESHSISILEKLDVLSSEQQFEAALNVLETEKKNLQKIDMEGNLISSENCTSRRCALLEWRIRLADQLVAMAGHPRVTAPELQKSLYLLCRLDDSCRANSLLIQFYHSHLVNRMHDLQCSKALLSQMYVIELAKTVFSVISQAARSFVMLYGEASPYSSEFMVWVMEEIKVFTHYFDMYIKSNFEMNRGLYLAVEGMKCAFSFCSLLEPQRLYLHSSLMKSIRPCIEEALQRHMDYLRKTINIFTATDTWILGKFLVSEITRENSSCVGDRGKLAYCLLTNSGRQFITLIQEFLEDASPLSCLQMESPILRGLADLFNEYIRIPTYCMPNFGNSVEKGPPGVSSTRTLSQQLSLLVNLWTLVDFLCSIAKCIFADVKASNDDEREKELDCWISSIQDAADQLRGYFCKQFVDGYISVTERDTRMGSESYIKSLHLPSSIQALRPTSEFQMLFHHLQQLHKCGKSVFGNADEKAEKLLNDLMDTAVATISSNIKLWRENEHSSHIQQSVWFKQFVLDMHFLVEIAKFGGYLSDRSMEASRILMANVENTFINTELDTSSAVTDNAWASAAAKEAIQKLVEMEATKLERDAKYMNAFEVYFDCEGAQTSSEQDATESIELSDREVETFAGWDATKQQGIEKSGVNPLDGITTDVNTRVSNVKNSRSLSSAYSDVEEVEDALWS